MCNRSSNGSQFQFSFCPHGTVSMHLGSTTIRLQREEFADFVLAADHALSHIMKPGANDHPTQPWTN